MSIFDGIELPADQSDKPVDLPPDNQDTPDASSADAASESVTPLVDDQPVTETPPVVADAVTPPDGTPPADADPAKADAETPQDQKKPDDTAADLTPFHQHPDWKKMQERLEVAEHRAAEAERQAAEASKAARANPELDGLTAPQIATKLVEKKAAAGWKPKDQLEVSEAYASALEEAQAVVKNRETETQTDTLKSVQKAVDDKFMELGITDPVERKKVEDKVSAWAKDGIQVSMGSFTIAAENLKLKGEIGVPKVPTQTADSKEKEAKEKQARDDANRKLGKRNGTGDKPAKAKLEYGYLHNTDLDTIILEQGQRLG